MRNNHTAVWFAIGMLGYVVWGWWCLLILTPVALVDGVLNRD